MTTRFDARFGRGCGMRLGGVLLALAVLCAVQRAPAAAQDCVGDCSNDGAVTVDELLMGVNIALGTLSLDQCALFDMSGNGAVSVDEILVAVNKALYGCSESAGFLSLDKISLAVFLDGRDSVEVTAKDENWKDSDSWTVTSSNEEIAIVGRDGKYIDVSGVGLGDATITVTTDWGMQRILPVKVYDHTVLDYGEILLRYVNTFDSAYSLLVYNLLGSAFFMEPVVPEGWHALGFTGVRCIFPDLVCAYPANERWMILVKADEADADPLRPPLMPPIDYEEEWAWFGTSFWTPVCSNGYAAMGSVVTAFPVPPNPDQVTCVREDLTTHAESGDLIWNDRGTGGSVPYQGTFRIKAPNNTASDRPIIYIEAGTFVTQGQFRSCIGENCWTPPEQGAHEVMHVLALDPELLIDATNERAVLFEPPRSCIVEGNPPAFSEPKMTKTMLVPFTTLQGDKTLPGDEAENEDEYSLRGVPWMIENSPFVRVERTVVWHRQFGMANFGDIASPAPSSEWKTGINETSSHKYWHSTGVSLSAGIGIQYKGFSAGVGATVTKEFGYEFQTSTSIFVEKTQIIPVIIPPHTFQGVFREQSRFRVQLHNPVQRALEDIQNEDEYDDFNLNYSEYGPCR